MSSSERNRAAWDRISDEYQARNAEFIGRKDEPRWGMWQLPDSELGILGDVAGKDVLELGCGAAQWSILLGGARRAGGRARQLGAAARARARADGGGGRRLPARPSRRPRRCRCRTRASTSSSATTAAMTFGDPYLTVPEAARLLRPGGLFAFSHSTPLAMCCWSEETETIERRLVRDYFGMHRFDELPDEPVEFNLPYGEWIRLFREHGFRVEALRRGAAAGGCRDDVPHGRGDRVGARTGRWRRSGDAESA